MSAVRVPESQSRLLSPLLTSSFQVSVLWKDSPENPKNSGGAEKKEPKAKKPTSKAASKPASKKADEESPSSDTD